MEQYISKSALVAIIKSRMATNKHENPLTASAYVEDEDILEAIDTLEVKEVDLDDKDIYSILYLERAAMRDFGDKEYSHEELCQEVLKRFKAQKGE